MLKMILVKAQKEKRRAGEKSSHFIREHEHNCEQNVYENMGIKSHSGEISDGKEK